ncbi:Hypothetical protein CINCED_3A017780, partial [Cinara cedri]
MGHKDLGNIETGPFQSKLQTLYEQADQSGFIHTSLCNVHRKVVVKNQNYIKSLTDILLFLACQGLEFRGHNENYTSLNQ